MFDQKRSRDQRAFEKQKFRGSGLRQDGFKIKPKEKGWSHQDELTGLIGKQIVVSARGERFDGELVAADQFTLKLKRPNLSTPVVFFKSSLTYFKEA